MCQVHVSSEGRHSLGVTFTVNLSEHHTLKELYISFLARLYAVPTPLPSNPLLIFSLLRFTSSFFLFSSRMKPLSRVRSSSSFSLALSSYFFFLFLFLQRFTSEDFDFVLFVKISEIPGQKYVTRPLSRRYNRVYF